MTKRQLKAARAAYMRAWRKANRAYHNAYFAEWRAERKVEDLEVVDVNFLHVPTNHVDPAFTSAQA